MSPTTTYSFPLVPNIERVKYLELYHTLANLLAIPLLAAFFILPDEKGNVIMSVLMPLLLSIPLAIWLHNRQKKEQSRILHIDADGLYVTDAEEKVLWRHKLSDFSHLKVKENVRYDQARWALLARWWLIHPVTYIEGILEGAHQRFYIRPDSSFELRQMEKLFQQNPPEAFRQKAAPH